MHYFRFDAVLHITNKVAFRIEKTGDVIAVEGVGNMRIERIEMSYDGTFGSTITASVVT